MAQRASFRRDPDFDRQLSDARQLLSQQAPGMLAHFDAIADNQIQQKLSNGFMSGAQWNDSRSMIANFARSRFLGNSTPDDRALGSALQGMNDALTGGVARSSTPDVARDLLPANAAYTQYKLLERAAGSAGASNNGNVFSPAQYMNAVRSNSTAVQKATSRGPNSGFAQDAQSVLGGSYPDSGTAGRLGAAGALGAVLAKPSTLLNPFMLAGLAPSLAYTGLGQRAVQHMFMNRPAGALSAGNAVQRAAPLVPGLLSAFMGRQ